MERKYTDRKDILLIVSLLITAGLLYVLFSRKQAGTSCEIILDGETITSVSLSQDRIFSLDEVPQVQLEIKEGRIRFLSSDCPDQTCVRSGFISRPGEYAVCLPHRLMIRIPENNRTKNPDAVTGRAMP
ncbi:MAG: NusG domain II-containing protein [Firmicutes bacterium]|nr:NusG domain II-containing protein [Bacillota bacterium]